MTKQETRGQGRYSYAQLPCPMDMPNLIETQQMSYRSFLQIDVLPEKRSKTGLQEVFASSFPIKGRDNSVLEFVNYALGRPKYDVQECVDRGMTYAAPLRIKVRLVVREAGSENPEVIDIREEDIYLGELPLMTEKGTFIINGAERVVISQLHRSPGPVFTAEMHSSGRKLVSASIIPNRGAWLEFDADLNGVITVVIDRKRKMPVTALLRAFGFSTNDEIIDLFCKYEEVKVTSKTPQKDLLGQVPVFDVVDPDSGEIICHGGAPIDKDMVEKLRSVPGSVKVHVATEGAKHYPMIYATLAKDPTTDMQHAQLELYRMLRPGEPPMPKKAEALLENLFFNARRYDLSRVGRYRMNKKLGVNQPLDTTTLTPDDLVAMVRYILAFTFEDAESDDIDHLGNRRVRTIGELLENQFRLGLARMERSIREKMSILDLESVMPRNLINAKPITSAINEFFGRSQLSQFLDQINPLAELTHKRRLSALGPGGLNRERAGFPVRDVHHTHYGRICPIETPEGPNIGLISSLATYARINEFGFIETPYRVVEHSRVTNKIDYLSADDEDLNLSAGGDGKNGPREAVYIAQANAATDASGKFVGDMVLSRHQGDFPRVAPSKVSYMDVSPMQLVSVSAALIPFLEHDDANRALMGSNMQRQAVPLLRSEAPLIGTGIEYRAAKDSGVVVVARRSGVVEYVSAEKIVVRADRVEDPLTETETDTYLLAKFMRSNQNTCINQRPIVKKGQRVVKGEVIADGPATDHGELALGKNLTVAFMSWEGYNFEDAIVCSERVVTDDVFTSVHIEEFKIEVRDTKLGEEEITRDIPNVGEEALRNLDENGIIRVGAPVKPGDILVGKISPKGKVQTTNVEKLLRAIFGKRAEDVRDISLKAPPGTEGTVIDVKVFSRKTRTGKGKVEDQRQLKRLSSERDKALEQLSEDLTRKTLELLRDQVVAGDVIDRETGEVLVPAGTTLTRTQMKKLESANLGEVGILHGEQLDRLRLEYGRRMEEVRQEYEKKIDYIKAGDNLPPGVIKLVKVYVAKKRKLQVGDKLAGRHGNKGVVAKIVPMEDMPFLEDGTPVDIVLNPLGVPSRMNVGQVLETHMGKAAEILGLSVATPVFDGAKEWDVALALRQADLVRRYGRGSIQAAIAEEMNGLREPDQIAAAIKRSYDLETSARTKTEIRETLSRGNRLSQEETRQIIDATLERYGKTTVYDGKTGEPFAERACVGNIYIMKLNHLVDNKIHARAIGPYSLVTQQPLGGKAQFGGQRLGEMEVWALEAYGAAFTLQELLTVKSDDIVGRNKIYESIVKGEPTRPPGLPESFYVLIKELQCLGLGVELVEKAEDAAAQMVVDTKKSLDAAAAAQTVSKQAAVRKLVGKD
ncbi:DNA-directed RNA polymerase subunit beta [bacterium]|nr:DNA-directed RNA polymerase subunit beta [bacterium]